MPTFKRLRLFFTSFAVLFLLIGAVDFLTPLSQHDVFPFYSWELGFGRIDAEERFYIIEILSLDNKSYNPPLKARDFLGPQWQHTSDYKIAKEMVRQRRKSKDGFKKARTALEITIFKNQGIESAQYQIREVFYNPLQFYRDQQIRDEKTKIYGVYDFEN